MDVRALTVIFNTRSWKTRKKIVKHRFSTMISTMVHYVHILWARTPIIKIVRHLRRINVFAKFENILWKISDVRVLTGLSALPPAHPPALSPAHPLGWQQYPVALKGCVVKYILIKSQIKYFPKTIQFMTNQGVSRLISMSQDADCESQVVAGAPKLLQMECSGMGSLN